MVAQADNDTVQWFGLENKLLYGSVVILLLSSLLLYVLFLLLDFPLWILCMENEPNSILINMTMEDLVGDSNNTCISDVAREHTKGIGFRELGSHILTVAVVSSLVDSLVESGILGTSMARLGSRNWYV